MWHTSFNLLFIINHHRHRHHRDNTYTTCRCFAFIQMSPCLATYGQQTKKNKTKAQKHIHTFIVTFIKKVIMSSRNFASKRSIKPKNNWKIAAALNIDYITFICLSLHTSNCISAPETETYSKNLFDLIRFMWTDLNLNIYKIATKTHTLIISRNVLSVEHNIIRPLSYRSGIETLKIQKKSS